MRKTWKVSFLTAVLCCIAVLRTDAAVQPRTFDKDVYPMDDTILTGMKPNVLFFLDTSSSMTMSMAGELPTFNRDDGVMRANMPKMRDGAYRAELLKEATYGSGARPMSFGTQTAADRLVNGGSPSLGTEGRGYANDSQYASQRMGYTRWGVDLDSNNNIIGDGSCYYSPDPARPFLLTFKDPNWASWDGTGAPPKAVGDGLATAESHTKPSISMPQELQTAIKSGRPVPQSLTKYLVPNDSKMYQMKLALWRLLEPGESGDNARVLSKLRLGVAGNFFEYIYGGNVRGAMYRRPPFMSHGEKRQEDDRGNYHGGYTSDFKAWDNGKADATVRFPYGTAPEVYSGIPGGDFGHSELLYSAVMSDYSADTGGDGRARRHVRRAYLRAPFDLMYTFNRQTGAYAPTHSLLAFRELIDGVEQYDSRDGVAAPNRIVNEELIASGPAFLSTSIYGRGGLHSNNYSTGNKDVLNGRKAIEYARGNLAQRELLSGLAGAETGILSKRVRNSEGMMAGTAVGSVIDFFSPFKDASGETVGPFGLPFTEYPAGGAGVEAEDTRGYFQVTGGCQANWLVVFTGGNEIAVPGQDPVKSLLELYNNSKIMRGRHWDGAKWIERNYEMDAPIRTIFVGMLPPASLGHPDGDPYAPDSPSDAPAKRLRKAITRMAHAGQPLPDGTPDKTVEPFFVDSATGLVHALDSILVQIRTEQLASSAPVILPLYDGSHERALFGAAYDVNMFKQWGATLRKYVVPSDGGSITKLAWAAEEWMKDNASRRRVFVTTGKEGENAGLNPVLVSGLLLDRFASLTGVSLNVGEFRRWLFTYDGETGVLGDMEHSGITVVEGKTEERDGRVYVHTNRGVLHSIDFDSGEEKWAFIPPNIFQNKMKEIKYSPYTGLWDDGNGLTTVRSRPLVLLDGMLSASDVTLNGSDKTYLIGNMGWGGNGLYAMDVTTPGSAPLFLWAVENARYAQASGLDGVKLWGRAAAGTGNRDYSELGLTISASEVRATPARPEGVGILPGGLGYHGGDDGQGKVFYIFNPENALIIKKITEGRGFEAPSGYPMGMEIAPVTYIKDLGPYTVGFFTADSEGSVVYCDTTGDPTDWRLKSLFQLRTVDGSKPVAITRAILVARDGGGHRWAFGGTSDLVLPDLEATSLADRKMVNPEQFIFALNLNENPTMSQGTPISLTTKDLKGLKYMRDDLFPGYGEEEVQETPPPEAYGWYLKLRPKIVHPVEPTDAEYVTTSPFLFQGVLYVSTFIPRTRQPDEEKGPELGDGKLYALDPTTGRAMWRNGQQALVFRNVKIAGMSASMGRLFLGLKILRDNALSRLPHEELGEFRTHIGGQYIDFDALGEPDGVVPDVPRNVPHMQFWKERF